LRSLRCVPLLPAPTSPAHALSAPARALSPRSARQGITPKAPSYSSSGRPRRFSSPSSAARYLFEVQAKAAQEPPSKRRRRSPKSEADAELKPDDDAESKADDAEPKEDSESKPKPEGGDH